jgi:2-polyprenyl-6-methoxyphenol hydroxylase-like FAD-dependent oxidoreductase
MDTEVLIVGAGPTGLMLALQLVRRGVRVQIIDRHSGPAQQSRAMAVHARTLEIYQQLGLAERAIELGCTGGGANIWAQGSWKARLPVGVIGQGVSAYPFVLMLGQDDNELLLGAELTRTGVAIQWNTELLALEQQPRSVTATVRQADGAVRRVSAAFLAGCDGGRSTVRELNSIGFPGAPYEHTFFVADTQATGPMRPDELNVYLWRDGFHLFFPMRGTNRWRVIGILPKDLRAKEGVTFDDVMPHVRQESGGAGLEFQRCLWFSTYHIHHRCAERFQNGRCFVLGDAAHLHSPMGGQGMNTGLQDAYNLAWKLSLVVKGRANAALLESYESERLAVAQRLLATTDRVFRAIVAENWAGTFLRTRVFARVAAFAMSRKRTQKIAFATLSQTGIAYPRSLLSRAAGTLPKGAPRPGDRFPWLQLTAAGGAAPEDLFRRLDDTHFNLLVFGQPAPEALPLARDLLRVHAFRADEHNARELARAGVPATSFWLLRPDGHVGLAGTRFDAAELNAYLAAIHLRDASTTAAPAVEVSAALSS